MAEKDKKVRSAKKAPSTGGARGQRKPKVDSPVLAELLELLPQLDEEGLAFLLEQAHVHRYNMEVQRLNEATERAQERAKAGSGQGRSSAPRAQSAGEEAMSIKRSADGMTYHVVAGGKWKMFSADEMAALVRITRSGDERPEVSRRIYAWLDRERRDALDDLGIGKPPSPRLAELVRVLSESFAPPSAR
ncbi:MAG TPA: hypothetical protein VMC79_14065 [Rectinemataceae bacterium]|nr:hypothetical protein [Rectinemataceae bacterium]